MKNKMILREFQKEDTREMIDSIRKTWHYDEFCSHKVANKLAKVFLYSCLANQTYTKVAVIDNCPIGIIMGKNIARHKCPFRYRIKQMISIISLLLFYFYYNYFLFSITGLYSNFTFTFFQGLNNTFFCYFGNLLIRRLPCYRSLYIFCF